MQVSHTARQSTFAATTRVCSSRNKLHPQRKNELAALCCGSLLVKQLDGCSFRKYRVWECLLAIETVFIAPTAVARPSQSTSCWKGFTWANSEGVECGNWSTRCQLANTSRKVTGSYLGTGKIFHLKIMNEISLTSSVSFIWQTS